MRYTAHIIDAYPCAKECEEVMAQLDLLNDVLLHEINSKNAFTDKCEEIFEKYKKSWFKFQDILSDIYGTENLTLWALNNLGRYTLYETDLAVDDVYFIEAINKSEIIGGSTVTIINIDEIRKINKEAVS
ncbi:hypothetical protein AB9M75_03885 [Lactobacillus sp. AN1001]